MDAPEYTVRDCQALEEIYAEKLGKRDLLVVDFQEDVLGALKIKAMKQPIEPKDVNDSLWHWLRGNSNKKLRHFIFEVPFEKVPLHINDENLEMFVKWRLRIAK